MSNTTFLIYPTIPTLFTRILAVWKRHIKVYMSNLGNAFPAIVEPLVSLLGIGLGLGKYIGSQIAGVPYIEFLTPALAASVAMWTSSFECTYGTYIRLNHDKVYHPMASTPINIEEVFIGEILFTGTKAFFFSSVVMIEMALFGYVQSGYSILVPLVGFLGGMAFGAMGILITSIVQSINTLNFYISGILTPMLFLSGTFFPLNEIPDFIRPLSYCLPLTHVVQLMRSLTNGDLGSHLLINLLWILTAILVFSFLAINRFKKRIII